MDTITNWHSQLAAYGAHLDSTGQVLDFGDRSGELRALQDGAVLVALTHTGIIEVSGDDALSFLNTQLTSDVVQVAANAAQYSGYCTPKGRLLATFLVCMRSSHYLLVLPREIAESVAARLQRYVLRAKVKVAQASDRYALLGVAGPQAVLAVGHAIGEPAAQPMQVVQYGAATLVHLPGHRHLIVCDQDTVDRLWNALNQHARPAGAPAWELQGIRTGIATVRAATQEAFIPQMLGLDMFGGISFEKGCYPGQEIVARTKYLGTLKRQLYYGRSDQSLVPGDAILNSADGATVGTVTDAAPTADDGCEFLAVLQREAVESARALRSAREQPLHIVRPAADAASAENR